MTTQLRVLLVVNVALILACVWLLVFGKSADERAHDCAHAWPASKADGKVP